MSEKERASRRDFLKLATTAAPAAAVVAVAAPASADVEEHASEGLRNTEHTKKFYDSARF